MLQVTGAAGTEGGQKVEATLTITRELQESSAAGVCSGAGLGFPRVSVHQEGASSWALPPGLLCQEGTVH